MCKRLNWILISIHAPRAGSDETVCKRLNWILISIHAPRAGSDKRDFQLFMKRLRFQSTLPVRGATGGRSAAAGGVIFQSTLPVRGATSHNLLRALCPPLFQSTLPVRGATTKCLKMANNGVISIHAPRAGSDFCWRR